jgi:hypothetical protein
MKKRLFQFFVVIFVSLILLAVWGVGSYAIVVTEKETFTMAKKEFGFDPILVDTREWSMQDYLDHPEVTKTLVNRGYEDLEQRLKDSDLAQDFKKIFNDVRNLMDSLTDTDP